VETKDLKRAVKRNIERFPEDFMFELTKEEYDSLRCQNFTLKNADSPNVLALTSQNVILKNRRCQHSKYLPYAFTEQGVGPKASAWQNSSNSTRNSRNKKSCYLFASYK
jgi:hypothetical protein